MGLLDSILGANGGQNVSQIAKQFGLDEGQAKAALSQLVPALGKGAREQVRRDESESGIMGALVRGNHERYLEEPTKLADESTHQDGNAILGHLFGSKDTSRAVAAKAAENTGIDQGILKKILPLAATMVMGSMSKNVKQGAMSSTESSGGGAGGMLAGFLDQDGDGDMTDDIMNLAKKLF